MTEYWEYVRAKLTADGFDVWNASPSSLADRALVLYLEGGREATRVIDQMCEDDASDTRDEEAIPPMEVTPDYPARPTNEMFAPPEGMTLMEGPMGVIPPRE